MPDDKQDTLSKETSDKGWQIVHAQPAQTANDSATGAAQPGHYIALKRDPNTNAIIEQAASSLEDVQRMVEDWERARPGDPNEQPQLDEEALLNSAEATLHMAVTAGARPAVDVDLTPAAEKREAKATRLAVTPVIEEVELDEATQAGIANLPPAASKTTGLSEGTVSGESGTPKKK